MHRVILVELRLLLDLAHQDDDGRGAGEERVAGALVGLPCRDKVRQALLERLGVDLDLRHCARLTMAELPGLRV